MDPEGKWLREATRMENLLYACARSGYMLTCYSMTVNTAEPIEDEQFHEAIMRLYRRVPSLRVCFRVTEEYDELWAKEMEATNVDFEVVVGLETEEMDRIIHEPYDDHNGPLWRARVVKAPANINVECPEPELEDLENQYHILIASHHMITDGYSMIKILSLLRNLLNDVVQDRESDDTQLGVYLGSEKGEELYMEAAEALKEDPDRLEAYTENINNPKKPLTKILMKDYELDRKDEDDAGNIKTMTISHRFDEDFTKFFREKCKEENVTVNSAFTAAFHGGLIHILKEYLEKKIVYEDDFEEGSLQMDEYGKISYDISGEHMVNIRRYLETSYGNQDVQLGPHFGTMVISAETSSDIVLEFWDLARTIHKKLYESLGENKTFKTESAYWLAKPEDVDIMEFLKINQPRNSFKLTNVGDLTGAFQETDDPVQVSDISRRTSVHGNDTMMLGGLSTFRGKLKFGLNYSTQHISSSFADKLMSKIVAIIMTIDD